jgi:uncharacterized protein YueI
MYQRVNHLEQQIFCLGTVVERIIKKMDQTNAKLDGVLYEQPQPLQTLQIQPIEIMMRLKYDRKQYREKKHKIYG